MSPICAHAHSRTLEYGEGFDVNGIVAIVDDLWAVNARSGIEVGSDSQYWIARLDAAGQMDGQPRRDHRVPASSGITARLSPQAPPEVLHYEKESSHQ